MTEPESDGFTERIAAMDLRVHHTFDFDATGRVDRRLDALLTHVRALHAQGAQILMVNQETKAAMARIETATTDLGVRVRAIQDKVGTGMTDADVAEVNTELGAIAGNLEGMAKDPENPIPPTV